MDKIKILIASVLFGLGIFVGKLIYKQDAKIQTVEVEKEVVRKDVVTVVKEVVNKDGTKTVETTITDKTKEKKQVSKDSLVVQALPNYGIGLGINTDNKKILSLDYRVTGNLWLTGTFSEDKKAAVFLKLEF